MNAKRQGIVEMEDDMKGLKKIARRLDQKQAKPLTCVKRPTVGLEGQPKIRRTGHPFHQESEPLHARLKIREKEN